MTSSGFVLSNFTSGLAPDILSEVNTWNIDTILSSNTTLFWYGGNSDNLAELEIRDGFLYCYKYATSNHRQTEQLRISKNDVVDEINKLKKEAGKEPKRVLFDVLEMKIVTYDMFTPMENLVLPSNNKPAFMLDKKEWFKPVLESKSVFIFNPAQLWAVDLALMSYCNNLRHVLYPIKEIGSGVVACSIISGLMSGLDSDIFINQLNQVHDINTKFISNTKDILVFGSEGEYNENDKSTEKMRKLLQSKTQEDSTLKSMVVASSVIEKGFALFMKNAVADYIDIINDTKIGFKRAFVDRGVLYIIPDGEYRYAYYQELFRTDKIVILMT